MELDTQKIPGNAYRQRNVSTLLRRRYATYRTPSALHSREVAPTAPDPFTLTDMSTWKPPQRAPTYSRLASDPLFTVDEMATRLNVSKDWVSDHSSRKTPRLPVIRMGDGS